MSDSSFLTDAFARVIIVITEPLKEEEMDDDVLHMVADAHAGRDYRPVAVAIVFGGADGASVLCVRSAKNLDNWGFPQGGIEKGEDPADALRREVSEEVGLSARNLGEPSFVGQRDLDAEPDRADKRGFSKGKRYFFFAVRCSGDPPLLVDRSEIAEARWVKPEDVPRLFMSTREDKRKLLLESLSLAAR